MNAPTAAALANPQTGETTPPPEPRQATELQRLLAQEYSPRDMLDGDGMHKMMRLAEQMATSKVSVPEHLRGNVGDCLAIITQAMLWNMNPFAVAQKTHIVSGRLGYEAQLVNAVVQNSGAVIGSARYEYRGEGQQLECRVGFVERGRSDLTWGEWLCIGKVTVQNSPLWKTNPRQQLGYLQLKNWARAFCPGAILGVYTTDELADMPADTGYVQRDASPTQVAAAAAPKAERTEAHDKLVQDLEMVAFNNGQKAFKKAWNALTEDERVAIGIPERDRMLAIGKETDEKMAAVVDKAEASGNA